ncbi:MAG: DUF21 domain-containing protein [Planctomycetaceae bacterium]|jgi:CBS domain containing-hemolysin-like protein
MIITALILSASFALFLAGMQLSAFFSGSETGFYRVSRLQLTLQKQQGDPVARRLIDFVHRPERFVATTLVGNNVANYVTTLAIGLFVAEASGLSGPSGRAGITATLMLAPVVFVFGELIPKSLYYRSPMSLLRSRSLTFHFFYYLFLPLSLPLTVVATAICRITGQEKQSVDTMFGRTRMFGLIASGKRDGILTQVQGRMADNLMNSAGQALTGFMESPDLVSRVSESANRDTVLAAASIGGDPWIFLHPNGKPEELTSTVRVATLLLSRQSPAAISEPLPRFSEKLQPLAALSELFLQHAHFGIVQAEGRIAGIVRRDVLSDQLLMTQKASTMSKTGWEL